MSTLQPSLCCMTIIIAFWHYQHAVWYLAVLQPNTLNTGSLHFDLVSILYISCIYHLVCIMYLCHMYANVFYPDACMNSSDCFWFCPLLLPPFLPFCPLHPYTTIPLCQSSPQSCAPLRSLSEDFPPDWGIQSVLNCFTEAPHRGFTLF